MPQVQDREMPLIEMMGWAIVSGAYLGLAVTLSRWLAGALGLPLLLVALSVALAPVLFVIRKDWREAWHLPLLMAVATLAALYVRPQPPPHARAHPEPLLDAVAAAWIGAMAFVGAMLVFGAILGAVQGVRTGKRNGAAREE